MTKPKITLVYIGKEQGSWGATAYPRPCHYYIMPGILYCAAALRNDPWMSERYDIRCRYFNRSVESREEILSNLLDDDAACVGFSCYCWNITDTMWCIGQIRTARPHTYILGGGPELSMKSPADIEAFFNENPAMDMLVFGDAEIKISALLKAALSAEAPFDGIHGYALHPRRGGHADFAKGYIENADAIPSIYPFDIDIRRSRTCGLSMVYETGRGCPYRCIYCQFGHRNHTPYRLPVERVAGELSWLLGRGIDCIHFADAVFDLDPSYAKDVLRHCIANNRTTSLFFYCSFYRLDEELACLLAASQAQLCVGIQTTNPEVLHKIQRPLSPRLFREIKELLERYRLNFYIDLIFGLPLDTPESFRTSFNESMSLKPSFVMVFPLTLIKGTPLEQQAQSYGIRTYDSRSIDGCDLICDIEYRNIALYEKFTLDDLVQFDDLALALFYFYNRFRLSLDYLTKRRKGSAAGLYQSIGKKTKDFLRRTGKTATNTNFIEGFEDEIRAMFIGEAVAAGAGANEVAAFGELFKLDIFRIIIATAPQREKLFLQSFDKKKNAALPITDESRIIMRAHGKVVNCSFRLADLMQLHSLAEAIKPCSDSVFVCASFGQWDVMVFSPSLLQRFLLDSIPADRPVRFRQLSHSAKRCIALHDSVNIEEAAVRGAVMDFYRRDIVVVF